MCNVLPQSELHQVGFKEGLKRKIVSLKFEIDLSIVGGYCVILDSLFNTL